MPIVSKRAIVTGAAGFIGSHLVDLLLERDYFVVGIDNLDTGRMENLETALEHKSFRFIKADIRDPDLISKVVHEAETIDYVFHLAAISSVTISVEDPAYVNSVNVAGTLNILNLARDLKAQRVVFSSSAAVYGNPEKLPITEEMSVCAISPYGASKIAGEQYMHAFRSTYGLETTVLRYFNVYGPRQAYSAYSGVVSIFVNRAITDEDLVIDGDGLQTRSLIYVGDVVEYTLRAAETPDANGMTFNIAGQESVNVLEIAERILKITGGKSRVVHGPPRPGDIRESRGAIDRAISVLGHTPSVPFEEGIRRTINWYQSQMV